MRPILRYRRHKTDTSVALDLDRIPESGREFVEVKQSQAQNVAGGMDSLNAGVINPSFVFLQLYHGTSLGHGQDQPMMLPSENMVRIAHIWYPMSLLFLLYDVSPREQGKNHHVLYTSPVSYVIAF